MWTVCTANAQNKPDLTNKEALAHLFGLPQLFGERLADTNEALLVNQGGETEDWGHRDAR